MDEAFLERITTAEVGAWLLALASATTLAGLLLGSIAGLRRRQVVRWSILGVVAGAAGFLLIAGWHLVVARTSFSERRYAPEGGPRPALWRAFPPARYYEGREAARSSPTDPMFRDENPLARRHARVGKWWWLVPADRLDSVPNLALLAVVFAAGGVGVGLAWGWLFRRLGSAPAAAEAAEPEAQR
jgi:hypothetical protein